jgi:hypothetical protein
MAYRGYGYFFLAVLIAAAIIYLGSCGTALPVAGESDFKGMDKKYTGIMLDSLNRGRSVYAQNCSGCHLPISPRNHTGEEWKHSLQAMSERAHLTQADKEQILTYLRFFARKEARAARDTSSHGSWH